MMKDKMVKVIMVIGVLSLLLIFMGQDECHTDPLIKQLIEMKGKYLPVPPGQNKLYVTFLSFMEARTMSTMADTGMAKLIEEEVLRWMKMGQKYLPNWAVNEQGHTIPNTDENVNKLVNITFDPNLTKNEKIDRIINELMTPNKVDMIVTGQYIDDPKNPMLSIRPLIIIKYNQKIITRNIQFSKAELLCQDPVTKKRIICPGAHDQIVQAVQELIEHF